MDSRDVAVEEGPVVGNASPSDRCCHGGGSLRDADVEFSLVIDPRELALMRMNRLFLRRHGTGASVTAVVPTSPPDARISPRRHARKRLFPRPVAARPSQTRCSSCGRTASRCDVCRCSDGRSCAGPDGQRFGHTPVSGVNQVEQSDNGPHIALVVAEWPSFIGHPSQHQIRGPLDR